MEVQDHGSLLLLLRSMRLLLLLVVRGVVSSWVQKSG